MPRDEELRSNEDSNQRDGPVAWQPPRKKNNKKQDNNEQSWDRGNESGSPSTSGHFNPFDSEERDDNNNYYPERQEHDSSQSWDDYISGA